jgi:thiaminase
VLDDSWRQATRHPFLDAVRDGTIDTSTFHRWLAQDAVFVADLLSFQARLLARSPRRAQPALASGCVALVDELQWFEDQAAERGIDMGRPPAPATLTYRELLERLDSEPYDAAVTGLWVIERVYQLAWTTALGGSARYTEFVEHWTNPGFAEYVGQLGELAEPEAHPDLVGDVLAQEIAFWDMAFA